MPLVGRTARARPPTWLSAAIRILVSPPSTMPSDGCTACVHSCKRASLSSEQAARQRPAHVYPYICQGKCSIVQEMSVRIIAGSCHTGPSHHISFWALYTSMELLPVFACPFVGNRKCISRLTCMSFDFSPMACGRACRLCSYSFRRRC